VPDGPWRADDADVAAGRSGFEPGDKAGDCLDAHGEIDLGPGLGALEDDVAAHDRQRLGVLRLAPTDDLEPLPRQHLLRPQRHAEDAVPLDLVTRVARDAERPALAEQLSLQAQAAVEAAAALHHPAAEGDEDDDDQQGDRDRAEHLDRGQQHAGSWRVARRLLVGAGGAQLGSSPERLRRSVIVPLAGPGRPLEGGPGRGHVDLVAELGALGQHLDLVSTHRDEAAVHRCDEPLLATFDHPHDAALCELGQDRRVVRHDPHLALGGLDDHEVGLALPDQPVRRDQLDRQLRVRH